MTTESYPYLPPQFPAWVKCAIRMLGTDQKQVPLVLEECLPGISPAEQCFDDPWLWTIGRQDEPYLLFHFDSQGTCEYTYIFLRGPVPQLGDCVRYFNAHGEYIQNASCWRLPQGVWVMLSKEQDEVSCTFAPDIRCHHISVCDSGDA